MRFIIDTIGRGIVWEDKCVLIGDTKADLRNLLGEPEIVRGSWYYFKNELRFDFDADERVEFIEFLGGIDGELQPWIFGAEVFTSDADALLALLKKQNGTAKILEDKGYFYGFCGIGVGIYRDCTPADLEDFADELLADIEEFGEDAVDTGSLKKDVRLTYHWNTIGLGGADYYK